MGNPGADALPVTVTLLGDGGEVRAEREVVLCGGCAGAVRLDFADADGELVDANGAIVVRAEGPVRATVDQLTVRSGGFQHEWGLPVLLSPGVWLGGWFGALLVVAGCGALLVAQLYGLLRDAGMRGGLRWRRCSRSGGGAAAALRAAALSGDSGDPAAGDGLRPGAGGGTAAGVGGWGRQPSARWRSRCCTRGAAAGGDAGGLPWAGG
ncbi:MAG: hypothetical protein U0841_12420 [Chloroflexia bacterium]